MINWRVRIRNRIFWIAIIPAIVLLIQLVGELFGVDLDLTDKEETLVEIINTVFVILTTLGIVTDPTTDGIGDSARALTYEIPRNDEAITDDADGIGATFTKRTTAPSTSNAWYYKNNPFYQSGYGLPNCTCYAWGRFAEILGKKPNLCLRNAENWWGYNDDYRRGLSPEVGAIACWRKGKAGVASDGAGHVAIVEEVYLDGSFLTSESAYKSYKFMNKKYAKTKYLAGHTFQGFIYNPAVTGEKTKKITYKVGGTYTLQTALKVRAGAGTSKRWLKTSELTADGKKNSTGSTYAVLKKGTKVTCQKISGNWMKIPSGWICTRSGNEIYVK